MTWECAVIVWQINELNRFKNKIITKMSFMSSEVLPVKTIAESNSIEVKKALVPSPLPSAPLSTGLYAIFSVVPINPDDYGPYGKPNAIVRPLRRNEPNEMIVPEANAANVPATNQSTPKVNVPAKCRKREIDTFSKELDNKLRHLQKDKKTSSKNVNLRIFFFCPPKRFAWSCFVCVRVFPSDIN